MFVNNGFNDINDNEDERISQHRDETLNSGKNQGTRNGDLLTVRSSTLLRHSGMKETKTLLLTHFIFIFHY